MNEIFLWKGYKIEMSSEMALKCSGIKIPEFPAIPETLINSEFKFRNSIIRKYLFGKVRLTQFTKLLKLLVMKILDRQ